MMLFDSAEDASQKLANTVIFYNDVPIYVHSVSGKTVDKRLIITATSLPLTGHEPWDLRIDILDKGLDWFRLGERLGYMNVEYKSFKQALYLCRYPVRKSIQGLSKQNVVIPRLQAPLHSPGSDGSNLYYENALQLRSFIDMLKGNYLRYEEIKEKFHRYPEAHSYAFHRWFAISRKQVGPMFLTYKGSDIGWSEDLSRFNLDKKYKHLSETLEDQGIDFK